MKKPKGPLSEEFCAWVASLPVTAKPEPKVTLTVTLTDGTKRTSTHANHGHALVALALIPVASIAAVDVNPYGE